MALPCHNVLLQYFDIVGFIQLNYVCTMSFIQSTRDTSTLSKSGTLLKVSGSGKFIDLPCSRLECHLLTIAIKIDIIIKELLAQALLWLCVL